jgi:hypothetical protein
VSAAALERALAALRDASDALWDAVEHGEPEKLVDALAQRESAFQAVVRTAGPPSPTARALLGEVQRGDRDALGAAQARLAALRLELDDLRQTRAALSRMRSSACPARFVSERA